MDFNSKPNPLELRFIKMGTTTMELRGLPIGLVVVLVVPLFGALSRTPPAQRNMQLIFNTSDRAATSTCATSTCIWYHYAASYKYMLP